jgi:hypothetical protein
VVDVVVEGAWVEVWPLKIRELVAAGSLHKRSAVFPGVLTRSRYLLALGEHLPTGQSSASTKGVCRRKLVLYAPNGWKPGFGGSVMGCRSREDLWGARRDCDST